jgi:hypothetical protein
MTMAISIFPEARKVATTQSWMPIPPQARTLGDDVGIARHEERDDVGGEEKGDGPNQRQHAEAECRAKQRDAGGALDVAGADILSDQRRHRHRQAHGRDHDDLEDRRTHAIGSGRQGPEARHEKRHDHETQPTRRQLDRSRKAEEEGAFDVGRIRYEVAPGQLDAVAAA